MALVLFDIDGTLIRTRGAGRDALDEAFAALFGWPNATRDVDVAGSTDTVIVEAVARRHGGRADPAAVHDLYVPALRRRLEDPTRTEVLPGVIGVLDRLRGRATVGLLTGNWRAGAEAKLAVAGLWEHFSFGAFAADAPDRNRLYPVAIARARASGWDGSGPVLVVGDTPADVACARFGGGVAVAVATGFASMEALRASAPDVILDDLEQGQDHLLELVLG